MTNRRSSQSLKQGVAASFAHLRPAVATASQADQGEGVGGWRQWPPRHHVAGHRTLRIEMVRYFRRNGCHDDGA